MRRTVVPPEITRMIRDCRLTRNAAIRVLTGLHESLPQHHDSSPRHPEDDRLCLFLDAIADGGQMHTFVFSVDDTTSPDHLIVVDLEHHARPIP